ncbi:exodeoxyribonuclease VII small subunit [Campylobacter pinnipediorum]|uniref:exodeoxyribonuclease VII small subunit n=1 Tax=Campylobacter pinnipediorum TaxID=1965231 RepID=UPI00084DA62D|nr:exodeoxyribonuclease VII small subunit [Campylobacter pinnipediorum]AQW85223.1 exodeoxyribonuclease VII, small subunit [Campylobacter pinnipediorum subsp. pinnipediorum]
MDNQAQSFEDKIKKAEEILKTLNSEDVTLQDSVKLCKDGKKLLDEAQKILEDAKLSITQVQDD